MEHAAIQQWSLSRSLALLAAIFAIVVGATLPTAVAASAGVGHPVQLCSGDRIFVVEDAAGGPVRDDPGPADSLSCAACLAAAFIALTPPPPADSPAAVPCPRPDLHPQPEPSAPVHAVRTAPRPPSTAPPTA